jgi:hypothetical protein
MGYDSPGKRRALRGHHRRVKGGKRGGKRSDPDYKQVGLYVNKNIHRQVMKRLAAEDGELSALLEALLKNWLGE